MAYSYEDDISNQPGAQPDLIAENPLGPITVESVLDRIATSLINSPLVDPTLLKQNQKTIRNGLITIGRNNSETLLLYDKDTKANEEDLITNMLDGTNQVTLTNIVDSFTEGNNSMAFVDIQILITGDNKLDAILLTDLSTNYTWNVAPLLSKSEISADGFESILNPLNISQFINLEEIQEDIKPSLADEHLNTRIYELLPETIPRQDQINKFFADFNTLIGGTPNFEIQEDLVSDYFLISGSNDYSEEHDISAAQNTPNFGIDEESSFITRLDNDANTKNSGKTLESMRETLNEYLKDIDQEFPEPDDLRPEYENKSEGYLQFRDLNQGIIIRNINNKFISGLNPETQDYLDTGFTITQWVRFKDQVSTGTLFNFGNPTREENPFGFKLETYVINGDDVPRNSAGNFVTGFSAPTDSTWGQIFRDDNELNLTYASEPPNEGFFKQNKTERFVRLVVQDGDRLRGSHMGMPFMNRRAGLPEFPELSGGYDYYTDGGGSVPYDHAYGLMTNTKVPTNSDEWYFICATYNHNILEDESYNHENFNGFKSDFDFWMGNRYPDTLGYTNYSNYGAKCKVEIISRTDLLRARGFKV